MKTGRLVWDTELGDHKTGMQLTGEPIAAALQLGLPRLFNTLISGKELKNY
jgi:hypothetical protein